MGILPCNLCVITYRYTEGITQGVVCSEQVACGKCWNFKIKTLVDTNIHKIKDGAMRICGYKIKTLLNGTLCVVNVTT